MAYNYRLMELRGELSQKEMAKRLGVTQQTYSNYESGKYDMKSDAIISACASFGCTAEWLLGFDTDETELRMLEAFRSLSEEGKFAVIAHAEALAESGKYDVEDGQE